MAAITYDARSRDLPAASCNRASSLADICCASELHTVNSDFRNYAHCTITGAESAEDCPPGWLYQADWSQCIRGVSTAAGVPSEGSYSSEIGGTLNACPSEDQNGDRPCSSAAAVRDICCVDSSFKLSAGTALTLYCIVQDEAVSFSDCPAGAGWSGWQGQCTKQAGSATQLDTCPLPPADPPMLLPPARPPTSPPTSTPMTPIMIGCALAAFILSALMGGIARRIRQHRRKTADNMGTLVRLKSGSGVGW